MFCEIAETYGFIAVWVLFTIGGLFLVILMSGSLFYPYYVTPTYEMWVYKSNPRFPAPLSVKKEIIQMCKGLVVATFCPAFTLYLTHNGYSNGYCSWNSSARPDAFSWYTQSIIIFLFTDIYEYFYHYLGHVYSFFWDTHRHHHIFYNPSPFSVIADEYMDQFIRAWPLLILPALIPIDMDLLFFTYATVFYGCGVYLHWGYETPLLSSHNIFLTTSYDHYLHHAISARNRPIAIGFVLKIWDYLFDTLNPTPCRCFECRPKRTYEDWLREKKYDYSVLLSPSWWLSSDSSIMGEKYE